MDAGFHVAGLAHLARNAEHGAHIAGNVWKLWRGLPERSGKRFKGVLPAPKQDAHAGIEICDALARAVAPQRPGAASATSAWIACSSSRSITDCP